MRSAPRDEGRRRTILAVLGGSALLVVVAVLGYLLLAGGGNGKAATSATAKLTAAGCTVQTLSAEPNLMLNGKLLPYRHLPGETLPKGFHYNSNPPTSGIHTDATVIYGIYDQPVPTISTVHNLEHGAVVIRYGPDVPKSTVDEIGKWYLDDPNGLVIAPMPGLDKTIALTAWTFDHGRSDEKTYQGEGHLAKCTNFDKGAFNAFVDAFRGKGPEQFPVSDLKPGGP